jgi:gamma-glutamyltranspeptidase
MMAGLGGDLFVIIYEASTGKVHGLNASGWAPKALTPEFLLTRLRQLDAIFAIFGAFDRDKCLILQSRG